MKRKSRMPNRKHNMGTYKGVVGIRRTPIYLVLETKKDENGEANLGLSLRYVDGRRVTLPEAKSLCNEQELQVFEHWMQTHPTTESLYSYWATVFLTNHHILNKRKQARGSWQKVAFSIIEEYGIDSSCHTTRLKSRKTLAL
jgi:hypothetical protein